MIYLHKLDKKPPIGKPTYLIEVTSEVWELARYLRDAAKESRRLEVADVEEINLRMGRLEEKIAAYGEHRYQAGKQETPLFHG
jgi:hypothetical protein